MERDVHERRKQHIRRDVHAVRIGEHLDRGTECLIRIERDAVERDAGVQLVEDEMARESCRHGCSEDERYYLPQSIMPRKEERADGRDRERRQRMIDPAVMRPMPHDAADDEPEAEKRRERYSDKVSP